MFMTGEDDSGAAKATGVGTATQRARRETCGPGGGGQDCLRIRRGNELRNGMEKGPRKQGDWGQGTFTGD